MHYSDPASPISRPLKDTAMKWILVLQLLINGQQVEVRSAPFDDAASCERSRDDWIERGADSKVVGAECRRVERGEAK